MLQERGAELGAAGVVLADEQDGRSGVSHGFSFWEGLGGGEPGREAGELARALAAEPGSPKMPGDPEVAAEAKRRVDGIPIEPGLAAEMRSWSARLGVASPL